MLLLTAGPQSGQDEFIERLLDSWEEIDDRGRFHTIHIKDKEIEAAEIVKVPTLIQTEQVPTDHLEKLRESFRELEEVCMPVWENSISLKPPPSAR